MRYILDQIRKGRHVHLELHGDPMNGTFVVDGIIERVYTPSNDIVPRALEIDGELILWHAITRITIPD